MEREINRILTANDFYKVLGVPINSDFETINKKYEELVQRFKKEDLSNGENNSVFKKLQESYDCLSSTTLRKKYDLKLKQTKQKENQNNKSDVVITEEKEKKETELKSNKLTKKEKEKEKEQEKEKEKEKEQEKVKKNENEKEIKKVKPQRKKLILSVLLLVVISVFLLRNSFFDQNKYKYLVSLTPKESFQNPRTTSKMNVEYYVSPSFESDLSNKKEEMSLERIESWVENQHLKLLQKNCKEQLIIILKKLKKIKND
ncbi:hypothetical protein M0813_06333 [Anaeramoeba flamelloides]|uniref:J domain-containing protein n=1 Tax=Anaeramoeba flamelloides TaxID=1746091 RepID=A0ABQ8XDP9_9EUKA|nr:hypothetical protein M0813_06333 [Anaeramoeba flamelloides]